MSLLFGLRGHLVLRGMKLLSGNPGHGVVGRGGGKETGVTNVERTLEEIVIDTSGTKHHHYEKLQIAMNFIIVFL